MNQQSIKIAIVHVSGQLRLGLEQQLQRKTELKNLGLDFVELRPDSESIEGYTVGTPVERATILSHALTRRDIDVVWAARGGYGTTQLTSLLKQMLPPVLPEKSLIGFSDISFLGNFLSSLYPEIKYIHANHAFDQSLFSKETDWNSLLSVLKNPTSAESFCSGIFHFLPKPAGAILKKNIPIYGTLFPINLSLLESYSVFPEIFPKTPQVLFIEELNEDVYRCLRKLDAAKNSGFLKMVSAIVLGDFGNCVDHLLVEYQEKNLAEVIEYYYKIPTFVLPIFGHGQNRFPLIKNSFVKIDRLDENSDKVYTCQIMPDSLSPKKAARNSMEILDKTDILEAADKTRFHFLGVGGTGMASVAGLLLANGSNVTGSDGPLYPPMSDVIKELGIQKFDGFFPENIDMSRPDSVIVGNVISRKNAELRPNLELDHALNLNLPLLSFPSVLRNQFLLHSNNLVVTGTHGKTTTTSMAIHLLEKLGMSPSYMVGGKPVFAGASSDQNSAAGFRLQDKGIFVLEGDEYDTAFFDKGPKFLHYEPLVAIVNNIEFDHADIFKNVQDIESEFSRLISLVELKKGVIIANANDERVCKILSKSTVSKVFFHTNVLGNRNHAPNSSETWHCQINGVTTDGTLVKIADPNGISMETKLRLFGNHNASNFLASVCAVDMFLKKIGRPPKVTDFNFVIEDFATFLGVKRRFELLGVTKNDIAIFEDFAHHPSAVEKTIEAFRTYLKGANRGGKLVVCFDPRNATMRRNVLQNELANALGSADEVHIGKPFEDKRIASEELLNTKELKKDITCSTTLWSDNGDLVNHLSSSLKSGDTVVFMSSGSFDKSATNLLNTFNKQV